MEASLAAQRAAIAKQTGSPPTTSFFLLPPPSHGNSTPVPPSLPDCEPVAEERLSPLIEDAAKRSELKPELIHSVARMESGLRPCAVSPKGAMGLMQLMPDTARELGVTDPFDPAQSIDGGARLLRKYLDLYAGSLPLALGAYNAGPARVNEAGDVPKIPETVNYVQRILELLGPLASRK
jgi:soluble lytic murein transglycosylase-like protein